MQLTCANCSARYLVDPAAIGPTGRTVQCFRCGHRWRASLPAPTVEPVAPEAIIVDTEPVPDVIIRPPGQAAPSYLPAIPVDPGLPLWLKTAIVGLVALAVVGGGAYLFRDQLFSRLLIDQQAAQISRLPATDGKTSVVISGVIVNAGRGEAAAKRLRLVFKDAAGKPVGDRYVDVSTGRIPPNGRARFEAQLDDVPAASAAIDVTAE